MNSLDNPVWSSETFWLWIARLAGAIAGSAVSVAYMLPGTKREAAIRFAVGILCGVIFGSAAGILMAEKLNLPDSFGKSELMLTGSALASLAAWSALGIFFRFIEKVKLAHNKEKP